MKLNLLLMMVVFLVHMVATEVVRNIRYRNGTGRIAIGRQQHRFVSYPTKRLFSRREILCPAEKPLLCVCFVCCDAEKKKGGTNQQTRE